MPRATASLHSLLVASLALAATSCQRAPVEPGEDGGSDEPVGCVIDPSVGAASALPLGGEAAVGQICPRGDEDWYALEVPAGMDLVDLSAGYPDAPTKVAISAQLFLGDGKTPVIAGQLIDERLGVRRGVVSSTLRVPGPGRYLLLVRDATASASDATGSYVVRIAAAKDPDRHEPNDAPAEARAVDMQPGFFAYRGDEDWFRTTVPPGSSLLQIRLTNPAPAKNVVHWQLRSAAGGALGEGDVPPSVAASDVVRIVPGAGDYLLGLSAAAGGAPDRRPEAGYGLVITSLKELDPNEQGRRNDSGATATCLGAPSGNGCDNPFTGMPQSFQKRGQIGSAGDRDFFRFDVGAGVPALVELDARIAPTLMKLALDLVVPHPTSPCSRDAECVAINAPCKSNGDCELSHSCLPAGPYTFCPNGQPCRLCAGAVACVPDGKPGGKSVCGAPQYLLRDAEGLQPEQGGQNVLRTAQPLLQSGPVYVIVHDFQDLRSDRTHDYSLDVRVVPEPDPGDQSPTAAARNNFYNPYPMPDDNLGASAARALDVSDELLAGNPIKGFLSYSSDEDWFAFRHPCPKLDCGLIFEWVQPGPSPARLAIIMRRDDLGVHESFTYTGKVPTTMLGAPATLSFGEGDCRECSFASAKYNAARYYLQVRAVGATAWDFSPGGQYQLRLKAIKPGCPANCAESPNKACGCYCAALKMCPPSPML